MNAEIPTTAMRGDAWQWANAYKVSAALFALERLGILALLRQKREIGGLASAGGVEKTFLDVLLKLMEKGEMLERHGGQVVLSKGGRRLYPMIALESALNHGWPLVDRMVEVLRGASGHDYMDARPEPALLEKYCSAMELNADALSPRLARELRRGAIGTVVDCGGADGAMIERLLRFGAAAKGVVIDRPVMQAAFSKRFRDKQNPVRFISADLRDAGGLAPFFHDADAAVFSNVFHMMPLQCVERLVFCAAEAARAGSAIYVYDLFDSNSTALDTAAIMTVDWMLQGAGFMMTSREMETLMKDAGYEIQTCLSWPNMPGTLIVGRKP